MCHRYRTTFTQRRRVLSVRCLRLRIHAMVFCRGTQEVQTRGGAGGNHALRAPQYGDPVKWGARVLVKGPPPRCPWRSAGPRSASSGSATPTLSRSNAEFFLILIVPKCRPYWGFWEARKPTARHYDGHFPYSLGRPRPRERRSSAAHREKRAPSSRQCAGFRAQLRNMRLVVLRRDPVDRSS